MIKSFSIVAALLTLLLLAQGNAQSSVWKVTKGGNTLYLGGTCHILRQSDYPLPDAFDTAYAEADALVFEVDPSKLQQPEFAAKLMAKSRFSDGRTLKDVLSAEAYAALSEHCQRSGISIEALQSFKPGMAAMVLSIMELAKLGVTEAGVDMHYAARAKTDSKPIHSLETMDFQINLISSLGEGIEDEIILYTLADISQLKEFFDKLVGAWRTGEMDTLEKLFIADMKQYPKVYDALLAERNRDWMPQIKTHMDTPETEFVLVGVAHLVGDDGLLTLLRAQGYTMEPVGDR